MFGLIGPDGAGKSTLIRVLCGILKDFDGIAVVLDLDLSRDSEHIKKRIGYLSQDFSLYKDLTVDENIEFFADIHEIGDFHSRRERLLDFTRMKAFRKRKAGKLSGGMKKKLALACTLVHTPDIIFLDEPTNGVDPVSRREFWGILSGLLDSGVTVFMTTPYIDEAERCTRVAMINEGGIMACEEPGRLRDQFRWKITEVVTADVVKAIRLLKQGGMTDIQTFGDRLHIYSEETDALAGDVKKLLEDIPVSAVRQVRPSLEDVFIEYLDRQRR